MVGAKNPSVFRYLMNNSFLSGLSDLCANKTHESGSFNFRLRALCETSGEDPVEIYYFSN